MHTKHSGITAISISMSLLIHWSTTKTLRSSFLQTRQTHPSSCQIGLSMSRSHTFDIIPATTARTGVMAKITNASLHSVTKPTMIPPKKVDIQCTNNPALSPIPAETLFKSLQETNETSHNKTSENSRFSVGPLQQPFSRRHSLYPQEMS